MTLYPLFYSAIIGGTICFVSVLLGYWMGRKTVTDRPILEPANVDQGSATEGEIDPYRVNLDAIKSRERQRKSRMNGGTA